MTNPSRDEVSFDAESTRVTLEEVCARAGLDYSDAKLLRVGENALYQLSSVPVVVRIARTSDYLPDVEKEVRVADWLASIDFPGVRLFNIPGQPLQSGGRPVTFWHYYPGRPGGRGDVTKLGSLLRRLHRTAPPAGLSLPTEDVLGRVRERIGSAPVPQSDKTFLLERCTDLSDQIRVLRFPLQPTVIHGDAHVQNLLVQGGEVILIDFERFAWGQPEWDLSVTATEYLTAGWWTSRQYEAFHDAYGFDVTGWDGFPLLRAVQEIRMTTWIMQNVGQSSRIAAEYEQRMRDIRTGEGGSWTAF